MAVIIVQNKNIKSESEKPKKFARQRLNDSQYHVHQNQAKELLNMEEFVLPKEECVLVGDTTGNGSMKAKVLLPTEKEKPCFLYEETDKKVLSLPKNAVSIGRYKEEVRIYSSDGIAKIVKAPLDSASNEITVLGAAGKLYFRVGKSHKEQQRELREKNFAKNGVARYY